MQDVSTVYLEAVEAELKIVLVVPVFPVLSETFIVSKFLGLLDRGYDVHIVCGRHAKENWALFPALQARRQVAKHIHASWPTQHKSLAALLLPVAIFYALLVNARTTFRYLRKGYWRFGPDVLRRFYLDLPLILNSPDIVHFEFGALAVGRMYLRDLLGCRVTVSFRGYDLNFSGLDQPDYYQEIWIHAAGLHLLGEDLWQRALRRGCPPDKPHALIPPAIDADFFDPADREISANDGSLEHPIRILSVGRLEWKKGYEYALQAIKMLRDHGFHVEYHIVGDGQYLTAIAFCRHQLGLEDCVHLLGARSRDGVREEMRWADIFLHAAVSEGFCNAVLEAQAMCLPVVCSDADGLPENVLDGVTGFVVPRRNPVALADKLALLATDPEIRRRIGQAGRERVRNHFGLEQQLEAFASFYDAMESLHG